MQQLYHQGRFIVAGITVYLRLSAACLL